MCELNFFPLEDLEVQLKHNLNKSGWERFDRGIEIPNIVFKKNTSLEIPQGSVLFQWKQYEYYHVISE